MSRHFTQPAPRAANELTDRSNKQLAAYALAAIVVFACVPFMMAQGTYTQIDYPGAADTNGQGINNHGDVSGWFVFTSGLPQNGFVLRNGVYSNVDYPQKRGTTLFGINDAGEIVGSTPQTDIGFLYDANQFTTIAYPNALITYPYAINDAGNIVGYFLNKQQEDIGFELVGTSYVPIIQEGWSGSVATGITAEGSVVGYTLNERGTLVNFIETDGSYSVLVIPGAPDASVTGISPNGNILVGDYQPSSGVFAAFSYQGGVVQNIEFPGAAITLVSEVNDSGVVVGTWEDASGDSHGFTWTPPAADEKK